MESLLGGARNRDAGEMITPTKSRRIKIKKKETCWKKKRFSVKETKQSGVNTGAANGSKKGGGSKANDLSSFTTARDDHLKYAKSRERVEKEERWGEGRPYGRMRRRLSIRIGTEKRVDERRVTIVLLLPKSRPQKVARPGRSSRKRQQTSEGDRATEKSACGISTERKKEK